jgi:hypothetical protein
MSSSVSYFREKGLQIFLCFGVLLLLSCTTTDTTRVDSPIESVDVLVETSLNTSSSSSLGRVCVPGVIEYKVEGYIGLCEYPLSEKGKAALPQFIQSAGLPEELTQWNGRWDHDNITKTLCQGIFKRYSDLYQHKVDYRISDYSCHLGYEEGKYIYSGGLYIVLAEFDQRYLLLFIQDNQTMGSPVLFIYAYDMEKNVIREIDTKGADGSVFYQADTLTIGVAEPRTYDLKKGEFIKS